MADVLYNWPMPRRVLVKDILKQTAEETGILAEMIMGKLRIRRVSRARHKFFYDCKDKLNICEHRISVITGFDKASVGYGIFWHADREDLPKLTNFNGRHYKKMGIELRDKKADQL